MKWRTVDSRETDNVRPNTSAAHSVTTRLRLQLTNGPKALKRQYRPISKKIFEVRTFFWHVERFSAIELAPLHLTYTLNAISKDTRLYGTSFNVFYKSLPLAIITAARVRRAMQLANSKVYYYQFEELVLACSHLGVNSI